MHRSRLRRERRPRGRAAMAGVVAAAAALLIGCADTEPDDAATAPVGGLPLRLVIPDATMREPDAPCAGARAFRFAHPRAPYTVADRDGQAVAAGTLPEGRAEKAFNVDLGEGRQPTVCVMSLEVAGVDSLDEHSLIIGDRAPVPIGRNRNLGEIAEVVLQ